MATQIFFMFTPILGRWTHFDEPFSKGLVQPPTRSLCFFLILFGWLSRSRQNKTKKKRTLKFRLCILDGHHFFIPPWNQIIFTYLTESSRNDLKFCAPENPPKKQTGPFCWGWNFLTILKTNPWVDFRVDFRGTNPPTKAEFQAIKRYTHEEKKEKNICHQLLRPQDIEVWEGVGLGWNGRGDSFVANKGGKRPMKSCKFFFFAYLTWKCKSTIISYPHLFSPQKKLHESSSILSWCMFQPKLAVCYKDASMVHGSVELMVLVFVVDRAKQD